MAATLADLVVRFSADMAQLTSSITRAEHQFTRFKGNVNRILGTIGVGIGAGAFVSFIKGTIDAAAALNDLRRRTGASGQELLILQGAAVRGGSSMEAVSGVVSRLSTRMIEAAKGTGDAAAAYQAMGISVKNADGSLKNNVDLLREVGDRFREYEDGANKATLANAALGKGGDALIPVIEALRETEERFKRLGITVSDDVLEAADQFNDTMADVRSVIDVISRNLIATLLPYLQRLAEFLVDVAKDAATMEMNMKAVKVAIDTVLFPLKVMATGFITLGGAIAYASELLVGFSLAIQTRFAQQAQALSDYFEGIKSFSPSKIFDASKRLASLDFSEPVAEWRAALERANKTLDGTAGIVTKIWRDGEKAQELAGPPESLRPRPRRRQAPGIPDLAAAKAADDALRALQDQRTKIELAALQQAGKQRAQLLDLQYQNNLVGELDYWRARMGIQKEAMDAELAALNQQLTRQQEVAARAAPRSKEYYAAQKDVEATQAAINKLTSEFQHAAATSWYAAQKAADDYRRSIADIDAQILSLQGREAEATRMRLQTQNEDLRRRFTANQDYEALAKLDTLEQLQVAQAEFNQARERQGAITAQLAMEEERIQNAVRLGSVSELEAMQRTSEARQRAAADLEAVVANMERVAREARNPALELAAKRARHELEILKEQSDLVAQKVAEIFGSAFSDAFADFLDGTKSAKEAFNDFAKSVLRDINRMLAEWAKTKIFEALGIKTPGGGFGGSRIPGQIDLFGAIAGFFGGGGSAIGYGAAGTAASTAMVATVGGGFVPALDVGMDYVPNDGLAFLHKGEAVLTAAENASRSGRRPINVTNVFHVSGQTDRRSQSQIAVAAGRGLERSLARDD